MSGGLQSTGGDESDLDDLKTRLKLETTDIMIALFARIEEIVGGSSSALKLIVVDTFMTPHPPRTDLGLLGRPIVDLSAQSDKVLLFDLHPLFPVDSVAYFCLHSTGARLSGPRSSGICDASPARGGRCSGMGATEEVTWIHAVIASSRLIV